MSEYHMSISGKIKTCDFSSINHYLNIVNFEDNLVITMERDSHGNVDILGELCKKNKLLIYNQEDSSNGQCVIKVIKDKHFNE